MFRLTKDEFQNFKEKAKELLLRKSYYDLSVRQPVVVKLNEAIEEINNYLVVDFKYMSEMAFREHPDIQVEKTVKKQLVYEMALKLNRGAFTKSEFWIPSYIGGRYEQAQRVIRRYSKVCDPFFKKFRISIIQLDFLTVQQIYIQDGV